MAGITGSAPQRERGRRRRTRADLGPATAGLKAPLWLELGRVSNLPTVWSNVLAGAILVGASPWQANTAIVLVSLTLFYLGGMYLNDACDAEIDARERADRPIPRGDVGRLTVTLLGSLMLVVGALALFLTNLAAGVTGLALIAAIVGYDGWHKRIGWSPLLMGACRLLTYLAAAFALTGSVGSALLAGAFGLACHVVGLTYAARQEAYDRIGAAWPLGILALPALLLVVALASAPSLSALGITLGLGYLLWCLRCLFYLMRRAPGDVPRAVVGLIAAISIYDATLMAASGASLAALAAALAFVATLTLQRVTSGT